MRLLERWLPGPVVGSQWALVGILAAAEFARTALIVALLPTYMTGPLGAPLTLVGFAISVHYLMDTVFRSPMGWLVDWLGPRITLVLGMSIELVALVGAARTHQPTWMLVWLGVLGIGTATHWPAVVTGTNRLTQSVNRGAMMGLVYASWLAGSGMGPVVINFVIGSLGSDRLAFDILIAADALAFGLTFLLRRPEVRREPGHHRPRLAMDGLRRIWPLRAVLPGMFVQTLVLGELLPVLQPLTHQVLHLSQWEYAALLLGSGTLTVLFLIPMGRVSDKMGLKLPLIGGFWLAGLALLGLSVIRDFWLLIVVGGLAGFAYALILPAWNAFLARLIPADQEGLLWGVFMTVEGLGMTVGPVVGAHLFQLSPAAPFILAALILGVMGFFYWFFPMPEPRTAVL